MSWPAIPALFARALSWRVAWPLSFQLHHSGICLSSPLRKFLLRRLHHALEELVERSPVLDAHRLAPLLHPLPALLQQLARQPGLRATERAPSGKRHAQAMQLVPAEQNQQHGQQPGHHHRRASAAAKPPRARRKAKSSGTRRISPFVPRSVSLRALCVFVVSISPPHNPARSSASSSKPKPSHIALPHSYSAVCGLPSTIARGFNPRSCRNSFTARSSLGNSFTQYRVLDR